MRPSAVLAVAVASVTGCASAPRSDAAACASVEGALPASASVTPMAGDFIVTMVADAGPRRDNSAAGYLRLRAAPAGVAAQGAGIRTALIGTTDVALEQVGARRLGDTGSEDPRQPGVGVYEQRVASGAPTVIVRVGSLLTAAPDAAQRPIEGASTVFFVRRVDQGGFAGGWTSGEGNPATDARGHFCAVRVS